MYRDTNCLLQAHRGVATDAPENTMAAFRASIEQGYDLIEFDPKCTKDGVWVVLHDTTLNRTGRIAGKPFGEEKVDIRDLTYNELAEIDVGEWFDPKFTGEHIPTMAQALDFMKANGIEGKIDNVFQSYTPRQQAALFDIIERHADLTKMGLTCTKLDLMKKFADRFPEAPLHYDGDVTEDVLDKLAEIGKGHCVTVWMHMGTETVKWCKREPVNHDWAKKIKDRGFRLGIWILINDEEMAKALTFGADVVETTGGIKP